MTNYSQTTNTNVQQWHNEAFAQQYEAISARLPSLTFWTILFSYAATAGLNVWAIHLPLFISVPLSIGIQALRFLTVFTPFLNPHGRANHLPEVIAIGASIVSMFELSFSLQAMGSAGAEFWSLFLFGAAILVLSMILEIQFINQGKKAFGLTGQQNTKTSNGAVSTTTAQNSAPVLPQQVQDQLQFLMNQNQQLQQQIQQQSQLGNGQAPQRQRPATANMGHTMNGAMNGHTLNHQNP